MLVRFLSSETGEILMYADVAATLLKAMGKACSARGTFTPEEMLPAAGRLREAVARAEAGGEGEVPDPDVSWEEQMKQDKEKPVALRRRAWPVIDMLERTGQTGPKAWVTWEAPGDF